MSKTTVDTFLFIVDITRENKKFHLVASGVPFDYQGTTYDPVDMKFREASMKSSGGGAGEGFNLAIPSGSEAAEYLKLPLASESTKVVLRVVSQAGEQILILRGVLQNVSNENRMVSLEVGTLRVGLSHIGLNLKYSNTCHHALYGALCKVPKQNFPQTIVNEVTASSGGGYALMLSNPVPDPEHYQYGFVTVPYDGVTLHSPISKVVNVGGRSIVFLPRDMKAVLQGRTAYLNKGCDLTFDTCKKRFNNTANFGGFPYFTGTENPFSNQVLD